MTQAAVIGAGPAGLMAAEVMAKAGLSVSIYEAKPSPARKFLMAGKSGLNLTFDGDFEKVLRGYGAHSEDMRALLQAFDNVALRAWAEGLGIETFVGSTGRVFPKVMKASPLLRAWLARLDALGVVLHRNARCTALDGIKPCINGAPVAADVTVLACGGASWARLGSDGAWVDWIKTPVTAFAPSNVGVQVSWSSPMARHFGQAIKSVTWHSGAASSQGEAVLTADGIEGGGIYALTPQLRAGAPLHVDLLPTRGVDHIAQRLAQRPKKTTLSKWLGGALRLTPAKTALLFEACQGVPKKQGTDLAQLLKRVPIRVRGLAAMDRAISTTGGVPFSALDDTLMVRAQPGVFCAGEMLDWDAPTGGWLLTACFATGAWAGAHAAEFVK